MDTFGEDTDMSTALLLASIAGLLCNPEGFDGSEI